MCGGHVFGAKVDGEGVFSGASGFDWGRYFGEILLTRRAVQRADL